MNRLLNRLYFYNRLAWLYMTKKRIGCKEYREDYDIVSRTYEKLWLRKMAPYSEEMLERIAFPKNYTMLDLACGTGFIIRHALKRNKPLKITGIDCSREMLSAAQKDIAEEPVNLIEGDINKCIRDFPDNSYDIITCGWSLEYMDRDYILKEAYRLLKKGGVFAVITNRKGTMENVEAAFMRMMEQEPGRIKLVNSISLKLVRDSQQLRQEFERRAFKVKHSWDREATFKFTDRAHAVNWVCDTGAFAGMFQVAGSDYRERLAESLGDSKAIDVTHRFSVCIGEKC